VPVEPHLSYESGTPTVEMGYTKKRAAIVITIIRAVTAALALLKSGCLLHR
jgi:hypothetical protein